MMGEILTSDSIVLITDVGVTSESDSSDPANSEDDISQSLICYTDINNCCHENMEGEWYLPDGSPGSHGKNFTVTRRDDGTVHLARSDDNILSPTGQFCCSVLDAVNVMRNACVSIGKHACMQCLH